MKKISVFKAFKVNLIIALSLLVASIIVCVFCGFNSNMDFNGGVEVNVLIGNYLDGEVEDSIEKDIKKTLKENKIELVSIQRIGEGDTAGFLVRFEEVNGKKVTSYDKVTTICEDLKVDLQTKFTANYIDSDGDAYIKVYTTYGKVGSSVGFWDYFYPSLAFGILIVVAFIYFFFRCNLATATTVSLGGILSVIIQLGLICLTRIPFGSEILGLLFVGAILSMGVIAIICSRVKVLSKNSENAELSSKDITIKAIDNVRFGILTSLGLGVLLSIMMLILGSGSIRFIALLLLVAVVSAECSKALLIPLFAVIDKKVKKSKRIKPKKVKALKTEEV